jgi:hypothetical protein
MSDMSSIGSWSRSLSKTAAAATANSGRHARTAVCDSNEDAVDPLEHRALHDARSGMMSIVERCPVTET